MNILAKSGDATTVTTDLLVCLGYEKEKAWSKSIRPIDKKLGGQLNDLRKNGEFSGKANQTTLLHINGKLSAKRVLLVGLGEWETMTLERIRQAMGTAVKRARQVKAKGMACVMPDVPKSIDQLDKVAQAMAEGMILGDYRFSEYRTDQIEDRKTLQSCTLVAPTSASHSRSQRGGETWANARGSNLLCPRYVQPSRQYHETLPRRD